ncbi:MAG: SEC-C domain-containing protein, partial [Verrucomicrobia bacterium]|nr:SEC-C domain-containing protein [Verrucomicrobiota bacterium]
TTEENAQFLVDRITQSYERKVSHEESEAVAGLERYIILNAIDRLWQEHLYAMDGLREGIYLRSYGQKDPLVEYKAEAYDMFSQLMASIKNEVLSNLFRSTTNLMAFEQFLSSLPFNIPQRLEPGQQARTPAGPMPRRENLGSIRDDRADKNGSELELVIPSARREAPKVGRNDPCPCGSGKKFKNCCGRQA